MRAESVHTRDLSLCPPDHGLGALTKELASRFFLAVNGTLDIYLSRESDRTSKVAKSLLKGIVQPFELGGVTSLIRSAVRFCKAGHFPKIFLMIQSHERSFKQNSAA
jgi:hypothetical protein